MKSRWIAPLLLAAMWGFALAVQSRLPDRIPLHWDLHGEPNGWGGRGAAFLFPAIATALAALITGVLPRIDPRRANWEKFGDEVLRITNVLLLFMAWIQGISLGAALGWRVNVGRTVLGGVGVLLVVIGNYLPRIRSNWFVGIRTPWTLTSERVWRETHRVGGRAFVAAGVVMVAATFIPAPFGDGLAMAAVGAAAVIPVAYSYLAWRREASGRPG